MRIASRLFAIPLALSCIGPGPAAAGVLCGTVRDGLTSQPVARAGVFLRTPAGAYTGLHGATDVAGAFCIGSIPAGTYDVEVRVDDYQLAYRRNVVVTDDLTDVEIPTRGLDAALLPPSPNPARSRVTFRYRLGESGAVRLVVLDAQGRLVRGWRGAAGAGAHVLGWDFRDAAGRVVPAGPYHVRLVTDRGTLARSFVRIR